MNMTLYYFFLHLGLVFGFLLAAFTVIHILSHRRSPSGTIAWLLIIVLIPYLGVPLYLAFGGRKVRRIVASKDKLKLPDPSTLPTEETHFIDRMLREFEIPGATTGNAIKLCQTGEDAYHDLIDLIEHARESIYIATFLIHEDEVGREVLKRLVRKAEEGVRVRLLLDGIGSFYTSRRFLKPLQRAGGRSAFFIPFFRMPFRGRTNLRNHRKIALADERLVMAGGTNIGSVYMGPVPKADRWKDLSFMLTGPAVGLYSQVFRSDWEYATGERLEAGPETGPLNISDRNESVVQVVPSGPDVPDDPLYDAILSAAFSAKERLWIVTPYFVPSSSLLRALILAARRGTDLRIIIPRKSNHRLTDLARGSSLEEIQEAGGKIQLYTKGMLHAKTLIADHNLAIIGSANMDMRSMFLDHEIVAILYSENEIRATEAWIESLFKDCQLGVDKVSSIHSIVEGVVRILSPLL